MSPVILRTIIIIIMHSSASADASAGNPDDDLKTLD